MAKKRQQVVTVEELKLKLKHEKASYWLHSPPLFGIIKSNDELHFLPVEPIVETQILVLFVLNPADFACERALELIELFKERYKNLSWLAAISFDQNYMFTKNPIFWEYFKKFQAYSTLPVYLDAYSEFHDWGKLNGFPKAFFLNRGVLAKEYVLDENSKDTFLQMETDLQELFRENDPGLPLPLLYNYELNAPVDSSIPGFDQVKMNGHWVTASDSIMTDDLHAVLSIPFEGKHLRIIASLHTQARETASRVIITFNDKPIQPSNSTSCLIADSHGSTSFEVTRFQGIFDVFSSSQTQKGTIQLHLKNAANSPIIYWGARISR